MSIFLDKLLSVCSYDISIYKENKIFSGFDGYPLTLELINLLNKRNEFYGFESALHVFPLDTKGAEIGLIDWNESNLWIDCYDSLACNAIFFAEDAFGGQFCIKPDGIYTFDPEAGFFEYIAKDINEWCKNILERYDVLTGYPLANI